MRSQQNESQQPRKGESENIISNSEHNIEQNNRSRVYIPLSPIKSSKIHGECINFLKIVI